MIVKIDDFVTSTFPEYRSSLGLADEKQVQ